MHRIKIGIISFNDTKIEELIKRIEFPDAYRFIISETGLKSYLDSYNALIDVLKPKVIIIDYRLGDLTFETIYKLSNYFTNYKIILLYDNKLINGITKYIQSGVCAFIDFDSDYETINKIIKETLEFDCAAFPSFISKKILDALKVEKHNQVPNSNIKLSLREKDVIKYLVEGLCYKEIANRMFISPHTARKHIANIYHKLNIHNKTDMVKFAINNEL
jgi:DNA-binding NarL/FixJ family response regulator